MSKKITSPLEHDLVRKYIEDLRRELADHDPREAAEILTSIEEHILDAATRAGDISSESLARIIGALGPVERIASAATPAVAATTHTIAAREWVVLGVAAVSALMLIPAPWLAAILAIAGLAVAYSQYRTRRLGPIETIAAVIDLVVIFLFALMMLTLVGSGEPELRPEAVEVVESANTP